MSDPTSTTHVEENNTTWKEHPTVAGIRVSNTGRVQSRRRSRRAGAGGGSVSVLGNTWRELRGWRCPRGYHYISVKRSGKNSNRHYLVHRLVLETFAGPCPDGMEALHADGNPSNNRLDNLKWDTHLENVADAKRHGTIPRGGKHYAAKLSESQVIEMLTLLVAGETTRAVASKFNVSRSAVEFIRDGKRWAHVSRPWLSKPL